MGMGHGGATDKAGIGSSTNSVAQHHSRPVKTVSLVKVSFLF
jgi:hypothetical protein